MKIKKIKGTFNDYQLELSYGQILAIRNALANDHADPVSDELSEELAWYLDNIPGPGEDEKDLKNEEEAAKSGMASPEAAEGQPSADDLLPMPGEGGEGGEGGPGPEGGPPPGEEGPPEGEEGPPGPPPEEGPESEADRRLPPPPEE